MKYVNIIKYKYVAIYSLLKWKSLNFEIQRNSDIGYTLKYNG